MRPGDRIPQTDGIIATPRCEGATIWTERDAFDIRSMPGKQGDLLISCSVVEPNTDTTSHREPGAVGRIRKFTNSPFTKARFDTFRQVPLWRILGEGVE